MTAQEYLKSRFDNLRTPLDLPKPKDNGELAESIFKLIMSKKFRKYSVNPEYIEHIRAALKLNIGRREPIKFAFVFGGYKLWRVDESPEVDWAELFSIMYYANWVKPICEVYEPGVWFDFFSDDAIVPKLNNVPAESTRVYRQGFEELLAFIKPALPANLSMTYHRVGDQYESPEAFTAEVMQRQKELAESLPSGLPKLTDKMRSTIDLNVKLAPGQADDPQWHEKVQLLHDAFAMISKRRPYYRTEDKIMVITQPIPNTLAVGTTKDSVMKFWVGAGVLQPKDDSYRQTILSPNQLESAKFEWQDVAFGLKGKNFHKIRVLQA